MSSPVGSITVSGLAIPAPSAPQLFILFRIQGYRRTQIRMIMNLRIIQRAHPLVEVQVIGNWLFRQIKRFRRLAYPRIDLFNMTDGSLLYQCDGLLELLIRTLLTTYLKNPFILPYRFYHRQSFRNGISQRLLAIYVFSRLATMNGTQGMPMIRSSYFDGINILAFEHLLIEFILITPLRHSVFCLPFGNTPNEAFALHRIDITTRCDLYARTLGKSAKIAQTLLSQTDETQYNPIARSNTDSIHTPARQDSQSRQT